MRGVRQVLCQFVGAEGAHAHARRPAVQVQLLRKEAQEQGRQFDRKFLD